MFFIGVANIIFGIFLAIVNIVNKTFDNTIAISLVVIFVELGILFIGAGVWKEQHKK